METQSKSGIWTQHQDADGVRVWLLTVYTL